MNPMADTQPPYWSRDAADLTRELGSGPGGLSAAEAAARLRRSGGNAVADQERLSAARVLLRQVRSPLVLILVFAAMVSLVVREWVDASIILAIVLGSVLLGFLQEYRASAAVAELRQRLALTVRVLRDGVASHGACGHGRSRRRRPARRRQPGSRPTGSC